MSERVPLVSSSSTDHAQAPTAPNSGGSFQPCLVSTPRLGCLALVGMSTGGPREPKLRLPVAIRRSWPKRSTSVLGAPALPRTPHTAVRTSSAVFGVLTKLDCCSGRGSFAAAPLVFHGPAGFAAGLVGLSWPARSSDVFDSGGRCLRSVPSLPARPWLCPAPRLRFHHCMPRCTAPFTKAEDSRGEMLGPSRSLLA